MDNPESRVKILPHDFKLPPGTLTSRDGDEIVFLFPDTPAMRFLGYREGEFATEAVFERIVWH